MEQMWRWASGGLSEWVWVYCIVQESPRRLSHRTEAIRPVLWVFGVQNRICHSLRHSPSQSSGNTVPSSSLTFSSLAALPVHNTQVRTLTDLCLCRLRRCPHFSVCWAIGKTSRVSSLPVHDPEVSDAHIPFLSHWWTAHPSLCFPLENQTLHLHWHLGLPLWCQSSFLTIASAVLEVYPGIRPHPVTHGSQAHRLPSSVPLLLLVLFEYVLSTQTHLCLSEPCLSSNAASSVQPFLILFSWVQRPYLIILSFLSSYMGHMPPCRLFSQYTHKWDAKVSVAEACPPASWLTLWHLSWPLSWEEPSVYPWCSVSACSLLLQHFCAFLLTSFTL